MIHSHHSKLHPIINCREFETFIMDYIDNKLPLYTKLKFKFHLLICPKCRRYVRSYINTIKITNSIADNNAETTNYGVPDEIPKELLEIIKKYKN